MRYTNKQQLINEIKEDWNNEKENYDNDFSDFLINWMDGIFIYEEDIINLINIKIASLEEIEDTIKEGHTLEGAILFLLTEFIQNEFNKGE